MNCSGAALLLRFDGQLRLMWWLTPTPAQTPVARGHTPSPRTLVVQADTSSQLKSVAAFVVARVCISHANASLLKAAVTLGGFPLIMAREFRGPAHRAEATSYASLP